MIKQMERKTIAALTYQEEGDVWHRKIIGQYDSALLSSGLDFTIIEIRISASMKESEISKLISQNKPDLIFVPDDQIYKNHSTMLIKFGVPVHVLAIQLSQNQISDGITSLVADPKFDVLVEIMHEMRPEAKKFAIIGGYYSEDLINKIRSKIDKLVTTTTLMTDKWLELVDHYKWANQNADTVFTLAPFGIYEENNKGWVHPRRVQSLIDSLEKPSLSVGKVDALNRTITLGFSAEKLGSQMAKLSLDSLLEGAPKQDIFDEFALAINPRHIEKFQLKIPVKKKEFITK